ncbi:MAG: uracil-DNA glycosylase [Syntrophotalea acetylenica]|jgi:DNA polymerase|uniref:Type-4 uracil-DNA glycosylase n=1 Tax=Syntrophotalea acetylenica TaxID=29542 RepID=A0A1L3GCD8_SYNAC|nr:uracil-DNA glycosylase [Syntrophotalea acetylenica]APG23614.1 DNA polymerase [Syntrophotalea acetylenica]APG44191.1 DNA polymerase [Syntrophotalea acetylenica]MDD4457677.1 uracil-DNA glycosylase [Syntrophotalea acetylenica]MDY0261130.1 uracil-DNA glycosylase [Syntrophotalea acetylenica]
MPDKLYRDVCETVGQVRGLLENLQLLGVRHLPPAVPTEDLPVCVTSQDSGDGAGPCRPESLEEIRADLGDCQRCMLCEKREHIVFGCGSAAARLVLVGEAPGREEDKQGMPFVGEAGRLLDRMLFAMGLGREDVYICNVLKCRPPGNRDPQSEEIAACEPFLIRQLAAIRPRVIVGMGRFAVQTLLREKQAVSRLRGQWREYEGIPLMPTYHPAYLLRNPASKREVWEDLKQVMGRLRGSDA